MLTRVTTHFGSSTSVTRQICGRRRPWALWVPLSLGGLSLSSVSGASISGLKATYRADMPLITRFEPGSNPGLNAAVFDECSNTSSAVLVFQHLLLLFLHLP